jgi:putative protease
MQANTPRKPELLAPVSTFETCLAAVHNGADAIYVGVPHWNARGRTPDLSLEELARMVAFCRLRGVRVFLAMNVLVFESELRDLSAFLVDLLRLEPDAFIVQDIGLLRLLRQLSPTQELHASTQMTLASAEAVACVQSLGLARVVLARELSLTEIQALRAKTTTELEVFVHGALCVSYSGQCLTSESFGGRSANRGQCAQSCRLPYTLLVDGKVKSQAGRDYLFSPQDLCALELVSDLSQAGVDSLKIEGRLKSPEYVAAVTAAYRTALDTGHWEDRQLDTLESLFSRGLFTGWLRGTDHQKLVNGFYSSHQGVPLGQVLSVDSNGVRIRLAERAPRPEAGDGVVFTHPSSKGEVGGRLYGVRDTGAGILRLEFSHELSLRVVAPGWETWRNDAPALESLVRQSFTDRDRQRRVPVQMVVTGKIGGVLSLTLEDPEGRRAVVQAEVPLEPAKTLVSDPFAWVHDELDSLSSTAYKLANLGIQIDANAYVPRKQMRELRQRATLALDALRLKVATPAVILEPAQVVFPTRNALQGKAEAKLNLLVRKETQLDELQPGLAIDTVFLDFDYGRRHEKALARIRELGYHAGIATLRIHKTMENRYLESLVAQNPDRILVRSLGALGWLREYYLARGEANLASCLVGDHSLNLCNSLAAEWFSAQGLGTLHPSWDLNRQQLLDLLGNYGGASFEVGLHLYIPTYHMEHCVYAAFLSGAARYPECKVPCMVHQVEVEDHRGERHYLHSDAECRNTLYLGKPQSMVKLVPEFMGLGVSRFRMEVLQESATMVANKAKTYSDLLRGRLTPDRVFRELGVQEKYGITEGQLFNATRWVDRKKPG